MARNFGLNFERISPAGDLGLLPRQPTTPRTGATTPVLPVRGGFSLEFRDRVCAAWLALFFGSIAAFVIAFVLLLNRLA